MPTGERSSGFLRNYRVSGKNVRKSLSIPEQARIYIKTYGMEREKSMKSKLPDIPELYEEDLEYWKTMIKFFFLSLFQSETDLKKKIY
jgi:hypothetical protein